MAAALLAAAAACADPPPSGPGTFAVTVIDTATAEVTGAAAAWTAPSGDRQSYEVRLQLPGGTDRSIVFATIGRRRPREGAYAVTEQAPDSATFDMLYTVGGSGRQVVKGTGGEIVITESSARRLAGRFDVIGRRIDLADPAAGTQPVRLSGTFAAPCTTEDGRPCN